MHFVADYGATDYKQLLDEIFAISGIINVEVLSAEPKVEADNTCRDHDYFGYHKNRI